jgi:hypothetical protein
VDDGIHVDLMVFVDDACDTALLGREPNDRRDVRQIIGVYGMGLLQADTAIDGRDGNFTAVLSPDWEIVGPNGGYLSAIVLRAVGAAAPAGHRPVSYSCQYLSRPRDRRVEISTEAVARGRTMWCFRATLGTGDGAALQAQIWTTDKSDGPDYEGYTSPNVARSPITSGRDRAGQLGARFRDNFDRASSLAEQPTNPTSCSTLKRWFRFRGFDAGGDLFLDAGRSVVLVDAIVWPTFARHVATADHIAKSVDLSVWFHESAPDAEWLLVEAVADVARAGIIFGRARVWSESGVLLASGASQMLQLARDAARSGRLIPDQP